MNDNVITVDSLVKSFNGVVAVNDVSFDVSRGEIFGFLGPNGAGKTTTINILCTLLKPDSGRAFVNGYDVLKYKHEVRESIGLVFQDPSLDDRLTGWENLEFHAYVYHIPKTERKRRMIEVLDMVALTDRAHDLVRTYSGGMKRRLEIARGLLHYPHILFLDEPTIGLDPQTRNYIWNYIEDLKKREEITIFLTTHYMEEAEHCERIAIIDRGKIIAMDTPDNLKRMIGGDVIRLKTKDDNRARKEILSLFPQVEMLPDKDTISFKVSKGDEFIPPLIRGLGVEIISINLHRPTLDDVFLKLTGREIREEGMDETASLRFAPFGRPTRR